MHDVEESGISTFKHLETEIHIVEDFEDMTDKSNVL